MAHIVHVISSLERGGAQAVLYDLVSHLSSHHHTIIFFHDGPYRELFQSLSIPVYHLNAVGGLYNPALLFRLYRLIKKLSPDIIHTVLWAANFWGRIAARMAGVPCVASLHNKASLNGRLRYWLDMVVPIVPDGVIAVSHDVADSFIQKKLFPKDRIRIITNGVAFANDAVVPLIPGIDSGDFVIGTVGRFSPEKRFDLLLHTFARVVQHERRVRLVICGAGEGLDQLIKLCEELKIRQNVHFVINKNAADYYLLFDLFVMTSASEGVSIALLQAMAAGCPAIITHDSVYHPVITHGHDGYVVYAADAVNIADEWLLLIRDAAARSRLGLAAQQTIADRFSMNRMVADYDALFRRFSGIF